MSEAPVMRTADGLVDVNTLILRCVNIRFQIAPGVGAGLGIADAPYTVSVGGVQVINDRTTADGEVRVPVVAPEHGVPVLRIFDTDFNVNLHAGLTSIDTLAGQQKRLDHLGYLTGYQLTPIANEVPDDGRDGARTQQSIMNLQIENALTLDGEVGRNTKAKITELMGGV